MAFASPEQAALAGRDIDSETTVLASAVESQNAALLLMSPHWHDPDLVHYYRDETGWVEGSSTGGHTYWSQTEDDDREVGVLVSWGEAQPGESALLVTFHGQSKEVPVTNGFYVWMVEGVARADIKDPAHFRSLT